MLSHRERYANTRRRSSVAEGGCSCGSVTFHVNAAPLRTGRSSEHPCVVFDCSALAIEGDVRCWALSSDDFRWCCATCGSCVFVASGTQVRISVDNFNVVDVIETDDQVWTSRRAPWTPLLHVPLAAHGT